MVKQHIYVLKQTQSNINIMQTIFEMRRNHSHQLKNIYIFIDEIYQSHGYKHESLVDKRRMKI